MDVGVAQVGVKQQSRSNVHARNENALISVYVYDNYFVIH